MKQPDEKETQSLNNIRRIWSEKMLSIYLGDMPEAIYHPPTCDNMYEDEWLTNPLSVEMIADVDKSTVIGTHLIESLFGTDISEGTVRGCKNVNTDGI